MIACLLLFWQQWLSEHCDFPTLSSTLDILSSVQCFPLSFSLIAFVELFISTISHLFSSESHCWISSHPSYEFFPTSFIYLFESSLRSLIILRIRRLDSLSRFQLFQCLWIWLLRSCELLVVSYSLALSFSCVSALWFAHLWGTPSNFIWRYP